MLNIQRVVRLYIHHKMLPSAIISLSVAMSMPFNVSQL